MIPNEEERETKSEGRQANIRGRWHYLALKKLSALLRRITSKHHGDFLLSELPSFFCSRKIT